MNETISIIIPTFQHANTLPACLDSILAQTHAAHEIIVVDDGSTDETQAVLEPYKNRIRVLIQKNQGAPVARNHGFSVSSGNFVLFCDADVVMQPSMLETLLIALKEHPEAAFAYSAFYWGRKKFSSHAFDAQMLRYTPYIHTTALVRRTDFPGFDETLRRFQDWDLWLTIVERGGKGIHVSEPLFRISTDHRAVRISSWFPAFFLKVPWQVVGWMPQRVKKYLSAKRIIQEKHQLPYDKTTE